MNVRNKIMMAISWFLFTSCAFAVDDGLSRFQTLNDYIVAFDTNHSLAIDELVITLITNKECQVRLANYISDGVRNKIEERKFLGTTMEEALEKK